MLQRKGGWKDEGVRERKKASGMDAVSSIKASPFSLSNRVCVCVVYVERQSKSEAHEIH